MQQSPLSFLRAFSSSQIVALVFKLSSSWLFQIWFPRSTLWKGVMGLFPKKGPGWIGTLSSYWKYHTFPILWDFRTFLHMILCHSSKEGLLEVGKVVTLFYRRGHWGSGNLSCPRSPTLLAESGLKVKSSHSQVPAFCITAQRCDYSAKLYTHLFTVLLHTVVQMMRRKRLLKLELELVGRLSLGSTAPRSLTVGLVYQLASLTYRKSKTHLTLLYNVVILWKPKNRGIG